MIKVFIVDDAPVTRSNIERLLSAQPDMTTCGSAPDAQSAMASAQSLQPDVFFVGIGRDEAAGYNGAAAIAAALPAAAVVVMGLEDSDVARQRAAEAGARGYLVKPFAGEELLNEVRRVSVPAAAATPTAPAPAPAPSPAPAAAPGGALPPYLGGNAGPSSNPQVIAVVAGKGGSGTSVLAANLALIIAAEAQKRVAIVDFDVEHGHLQRMLRVEAPATLLDASAQANPSPDAVTQMMVRGPAGVSLLASPSYPRQSTRLDPGFVDQMLAGLRQRFDVVIADIPNHLGSGQVAALRSADRVLLITTMSDLGVRTTVGLRRHLEEAGVPMGKVSVVINRTEANSDLTTSNIESALGQRVALQFPYDFVLVTTSLNRGAPFVLQRPDAHMTRKMRELAALLVPMPNFTAQGLPEEPVAAAVEDDRPKKPKKGLFGFAKT